MTGQQNRTFLIIILILAIVAGFVTFTPKIKPMFGLDIKGGVRIVLRAKTEDYKGKWTSENLEAVRHVIENRVNGTGVSEPTIITKPPDQIVVELPGLKDEKQAIASLQSTASLEFYWLRQLGNKDHTREAPWSVRDVTDPNTKQKQEVLVDSASGKEITPDQLQDGVFSSTPLVTGKDLLENSCRALIQGSGPVIEFEFKAPGSDNFESFTRMHVGEFLAVFLDKKLLTAPVINGVIPGGKGIIEGNFTLESAKALAANLNAGALPVPLEILETRKLEATLGAEAVKATTVAGIIGLALVLIFMIWWYRVPGVIANVALLLYSLFSIALFKLIPITLTLPGIAGFILSIGMAVDANILIFERLKEELRSGKTLRAAIDAGFKRAFTAIFDSNFCTAMTCCVLFYYGTGPIRGFALTLGVGVGVSMFTAITVTRTFLFSLVSVGVAANEAAYGLVERKYDLHVMRRKALWLGISLAIIIPGLVAWLFMGGIKKSIDFTGGTELEVPFAARHSAGEIEKTLASFGAQYKDSRVVVSGGAVGNAQLAYITTRRLSIPQREQLQQSLVDKVGVLSPGAHIAYSDVSGTISQELTLDAIMAVLMASGLIVLYLTFRFAMGGWKEGLKYGLCAVVALLHDVLVVWGSFAMLGFALNWQIDSLFVTAMLTVIGFSVHDTIIVFDRVRENLHHRAKGENFSDLTDRSIDQTFSRSLKTSFTVVLVLLALFFGGGAIINHFVAALLIGIVSGTYSSIFNASVLLVMWKKMDTGLTLAGTGAGVKAKSNLVARPTASQPGDRPVVTPSRPKPQVAAVAAENADSDTEDGPTATGAKAAARRQAVRKRRM